MSKDPNKIAANINYDFFPISKFDVIPEKSGIYSWFLRCNNTNIKSYHNFFKNRAYSIKMKGNLYETFEGKISALEHNIDKIEFDNELINLISTMFSPPIYIGISLNLNNRLNKHKNLLQKHLNDVNFRQEYFKPTTDQFKGDTDKESSEFAIRLAKLMRESRNLTEKDLIVKVIYIKNYSSKDELFNLEKFLNRTHNPLLGRN